MFTLPTLTQTKQQQYNSTNNVDRNGQDIVATMPMEGNTFDESVVSRNNVLDSNGQPRFSSTEEPFILPAAETYAGVHQGFINKIVPVLVSVYSDILRRRTEEKDIDVDVTFRDVISEMEGRVQKAVFQDKELSKCSDVEMFCVFEIIFDMVEVPLSHLIIKIKENIKKNQENKKKIIKNIEFGEEEEQSKEVEEEGPLAFTEGDENVTFHSEGVTVDLNCNDVGVNLQVAVQVIPDYGMQTSEGFPHVEGENQELFKIKEEGLVNDSFGQDDHCDETESSCDSDSSDCRCECHDELKFQGCPYCKECYENCDITELKLSNAVYGDCLTTCPIGFSVPRGRGFDLPHGLRLGFDLLFQEELFKRNFDELGLLDSLSFRFMKKKILISRIHDDQSEDCGRDRGRFQNEISFSIIIPAEGKLVVPDLVCGGIDDCDRIVILAIGKSGGFKKRAISALVRTVVPNFAIVRLENKSDYCRDDLHIAVLSNSGKFVGFCSGYRNEDDVISVIFFDECCVDDLYN